MMKLGDSHNGGKAVELLPNGWIHKPRAIHWEWLFLSQNSPLRQLIENQCFEEKVVSPFSTIPSLRFIPERSWVEKLEWRPFRGCLEPVEWQKIGAYCDLMAWFGISDLHSENVIFGRPAEERERLLFATVDIETVFLDVPSLRVTGLLPATADQRQHCGLSCLPLPISPEMIRLAVIGFRKAVETLNSLAPEISAYFRASPPIQNWPIRFLARDTWCYGNPSKEVFDLGNSEREQLERGDIPYFFRTLANPEIRYFKSTGFESPAVLPQDIASRLPPQFDPRDSEHLRSRGEKLLNKGSAELAHHLLNGRPESAVTLPNRPAPGCPRAREAREQAAVSSDG